MSDQYIVAFHFNRSKYTLEYRDGCSSCNPQMRDDIAVQNFFGEDAEYRMLQMGEKIQEGDVFVGDGVVSRATDVASGTVTSHHFDHYRLET